MRLFVAVPVPPAEAMAVSAWRDRLGLPGRQVPPENFHLTLRFIGDVDEVGRDLVLAALDDIAPVSSFRLHLDGLGAFPKSSKATVAWCGVAGDVTALRALASTVNEAVESVGLGLEERPFRAHLTLARIRPPAAIDTETGGPGVALAVDSFVLYRSRLGSGGVRYEPLERFALD